MVPFQFFDFAIADFVLPLPTQSLTGLGLESERSPADRWYRDSHSSEQFKEERNFRWLNSEELKEYEKLLAQYQC